MYFGGLYRNFEIIIIDDGSIDDMASRIEELICIYKEIKLLKNEDNNGKGYAIRCGIKESTGDIVIFIDTDLSVPVYDIESII